MPRYKTDEWGDTGYDAVDHLIDNDPSELAAWFHRTFGALNALVDAIEHDGCRVDSQIADPYVAAQRVIREWTEATAYTETDDF